MPLLKHVNLWAEIDDARVVSIGADMRSLGASAELCSRESGISRIFSALVKMKRDDSGITITYWSRSGTIENRQQLESAAI